MSKHQSYQEMIKQDCDQVRLLNLVITNSLPAELLQDYADDIPKLQYYYALILLHGYLYVEQDKIKAHWQLLWSAFRNYAPSLYKLGELYNIGELRSDGLSFLNQSSMNGTLQCWKKAAALQPASQEEKRAIRRAKRNLWTMRCIGKNTFRSIQKLRNRLIAGIHPDTKTVRQFLLTWQGPDVDLDNLDQQSTPTNTNSTQAETRPSGQTVEERFRAKNAEHPFSYINATGARYEAEAGITTFPDRNSIFADGSTMLADHFFPVLSINLGLINPDWEGNVAHLLTLAVDPYMYEEAFNSQIASHGDHVLPGWFTFRLNDANQYEHCPRANSADQVDDEPIDHNAEYPGYDQALSEAHQGYQFAKSHYATYGKKYWPLKDRHVRRVPIIDQLGGKLYYNNWCSDVPDAFRIIEDDQCWVVTEAGDPFYLIATTSDYYWLGFSGGTTFLLYEPISKLVCIVMNHD